MYQCKRCLKILSANTPSFTIITKIRTISHPARRYKKKRNRREVVDCGGRGTQIVCELQVCAHCRKRLLDVVPRRE